MFLTKKLQLQKNFFFLKEKIVFFFCIIISWKLIQVICLEFICFNLQDGKEKTIYICLILLSYKFRARLGLGSRILEIKEPFNYKFVNYSYKML